MINITGEEFHRLAKDSFQRATDWALFEDPEDVERALIFARRGIEMLLAAKALRENPGP